MYKTSSQTADFSSFPLHTHPRIPLPHTPCESHDLMSTAPTSTHEDAGPLTRTPSIEFDSTTHDIEQVLKPEPP
jgi:hypothetical protein